MLAQTSIVLDRNQKFFGLEWKPHRVEIGNNDAKTKIGIGSVKIDTMSEKNKREWTLNLTHFWSFVPLPSEILPSLSEISSFSKIKETTASIFSKNQVKSIKRAIFPPEVHWHEDRRTQLFE